MVQRCAHCGNDNPGTLVKNRATFSCSRCGYRTFRFIRLDYKKTMKTLAIAAVLITVTILLTTAYRTLPVRNNIVRYSFEHWGF